jgi:hypothetical protein
MNFSQLQRGELVAMLGGLLLGVSVFISKTYSTSGNGNIDGKTGDLSIWQAHPLMRFVLLLAALAPFILAWIIVREHELSWPRGQATSIVAIAAIGFLFYTGIVDRPGEPSSEISLGISWITAFAGALLMLVGSFIRSEESAAVRKPPGVL